MKGKGLKGHDNTKIIHIEDLVPIDDVRGGSGRILFGERGDLSHNCTFPPAERHMGMASRLCPGFMRALVAGWRWCIQRIVVWRGSRWFYNKR